MPPRITLEEQEKILLIAKGLIREPESWTEGTWKCPLYEDRRGTLVHARDDNGQKLYQYCIHGAVNEATLAVLGEKRAAVVGAGKVTPDGDFDIAAEALPITPAEIMGLNEISSELYGTDAMDFNDSGDGHNEHHQDVLRILDTRLHRVRESLARKKARNGA